METPQNNNSQNETSQNATSQNGIKKCPKCQEEISSKAKKCPKCQADLRPWPAKHPILTVILVIIGFGVLHAALFGESEKDKTARIVAAPIAARTTVDELADVSLNNSVEFEAKYENKKVEVSGYFARIAGSGDDKYVELEGTKGSLTVGKPNCYPINMDDFVHYKKGEPITVTGIISKDMFIRIKYCEKK